MVWVKAKHHLQDGDFPILSSNQYAICTWYYSLSDNCEGSDSSDSHLIWSWATDQADFTDYYRSNLFG